MNKLLENLKVATNMTTTTNGAYTYNSTLDKVYDLFATGAAMRDASDEDCQKLFADAYLADPTLALKCLFYLRDCHGEGQGERRFFRVCMGWLVRNYPEEVINLIRFVPEFGRWDDLYSCISYTTSNEVYHFIKKQLILDLDSGTPSLLAKWLKSENTSSAASRALANQTRNALGLTSKTYRKMLSLLRKRINIVETLMSQGRWDEIKFDKIPSRAGFIYRNAFAKHDIERYKKFIESDKTTVNAKTLYPYDVVDKAIELFDDVSINEIDRLAINKYWDNLHDYFNGASLNALVVADTSGSMTWGQGILPINVAISLALYAAEKASGPFHGHYISFSSRPQLIETSGIDFCDKVRRIYETNLCENTDIEATFDLILSTALRARVPQKDMPESIVIISDMQFDQARGYRYESYSSNETLMEGIRQRWESHGYKMPKLVFWNVNAASGGGNIPMKDEDGITFVSGASPVIFEMLMTGKTGKDCMMDKLMSDRYKEITSIRN